jgi:hypothetical protein
MFIVGARVSTAPNDKEQWAPIVAEISPMLSPEVMVVLTDSGIYTETAVLGDFLARLYS